MGRRDSLVLVASPPRDGVSGCCDIYHHKFHHNEIKQNKNQNNNVNGSGTSREGASSGRCSVDEQHRPGCNQATDRMKWMEETNIAGME